MHFFKLSDYVLSNYSDTIDDFRPLTGLVQNQPGICELTYPGGTAFSGKDPQGDLSIIKSILIMIDKSGVLLTKGLNQKIQDEFDVGADRARHLFDLPNYFKLIQAYPKKPKRTTEYTLTKIGKSYLKTKNNNEKIDIIFRVISGETTFGVYNPGAPQSNSNVEYPVLLIKMLKDLKRVTKREIGCMLGLMEIEGLTYEESLSKVRATKFEQPGLDIYEMENQVKMVWEKHRYSNPVKKSNSVTKFFNSFILLEFFKSLGLIDRYHPQKSPVTKTSQQKRHIPNTSVIKKVKNSNERGKKISLRGAKTFFHETIAGIVAVTAKLENEYKMEFQTGDDVKVYFETGKIIVPDENLQIKPWKDLTQVRFLDKSVDLNEIKDWEDLLTDAIKIGLTIRKRIGKFKTVGWAANTQKTIFGASDIILFNSLIPDGVGVSLKYGEGQLKNLSVNSLFKFLIKENTCLDKEIHAANPVIFNNMTKDFLKILRDTIIKSPYSTAVLEQWDSIFSKIKTWDEYQKSKLVSNQIDGFKEVINGLKKVDFSERKLLKEGCKYLGRKIIEQLKKEKADHYLNWQELRQDYFNDFYGNFLNEKSCSFDLSALLEAQLSVCPQKNLWYIAKAGTEVKKIPLSKTFKDITNKLQLIPEHYPSGSGYEFVINIRHLEKDIGKLNIVIRWRDGQMKGYPQTASTIHWNILDDDWAQIFK